MKGAEQHRTLSEANKQELREMAERDVAHVMEQHQGIGELEAYFTMEKMLVYAAGLVLIDDTEFRCLEAFLPVPETKPDHSRRYAKHG